MSHPQRIGLHLTDRCQLDCQHCLRDPAREPTDLSLDLVRTVIAEARARYGIRAISLTGGEPTLHPRFPEVLDVIAAGGCTWDMVTNGERFERVLGWFADGPPRRGALRSVTFSLDGEEATHDAIRGVGSHRAVLGAIAQAAVSTIPFGVQMAVHALNVSQLETIGLLAAQLGAKHVSFPMTQPTGTHFDERLFLPAREWERVRDRVESLARALSIRVILPEGYPTEQPLASCDALRGDTLHVDVHGRLSLCCLHSDLPSSSEAEIAGAVAELGLVGAHRRLLSIIHETLDGRLDAVERGEHLQPWGRFGCNACLRSFGKPHWTDHGAAGPEATRARWRGGWAKPDHDRRRLRVVG